MNKILLFILCAFSITLHATSNESSSTGIIADLRYMDVSVSSGSNQINAISGYSFTAADVGKLIAIKKGHHNPSTATAAVIPFTTPGRIVTITAQITSVATDGTSATINGVAPNQTLNTRAYVYTNNYDALQTLMNDGGEITLTQDGIIGVHPFYHNDYTETTNKALVFPSNEAVTIRNTNNARIKLCTETIDWDYTFALFASQVSNHNISLDISCIPPDEATTQWGGQCSFFTTTLFSKNGAEDSVRTIELKNTAPLTSDLDLDPDTDPFWNYYFDGVNGGIEDTTNFQEIFILNDDPNAEIRTRNGGVSQFGGGSQITITNLKVNYSGHYIGENGRSFTTEGIYTENDGGRWQFEDFEIVNGILKPMNPSTDFSWFDYVAPSRAMGVSINGGLFYQFHIDSPMEPNLADIINGHHLDISNTGLPNTTNATIVIQFHDDNRPPPSESVPNPPSRLIISSNAVKTFGHPNYVHPDVAFRITNITSEFGHWRYYATGNQYLIDPNNLSLGEVDTIIKPAFSEIRHSTIQGTGLQFQNFGSNNNNQEVANATRGTLKIVDSDIKARLIFGELELTDTEIDGEHVYVNSLVSGGGNSLKFQTVDVYDSDFISVNDFYDGNLVRFLKEDVLVQFENTTFGVEYRANEHLFPYVPNGTLHYKSNADSTNRLPRYDINYGSPYERHFTENTHLIFQDCEFNSDGSYSSGSFLATGSQGATVAFNNFKFSNVNGHARLIRPYFSPDDLNNGMATINSGDPKAAFSYRIPLFRTYTIPYFVDHSDINAIGCDILESNNFTIASNNSAIINPTFIRNTFSSANPEPDRFSSVDWGNGAYIDGEFTLTATNGNVRLNPFFTNTNPSNKRGNTTLSNLVLQTSANRHDGEIIQFKVDPLQNRVIEIGATFSNGQPIDTYYVDTPPNTNDYGLDGEIVHLESDDSQYWTHTVTYNNISGLPYDVTSEIVAGHTEIETGIYFSIKQELRDETPWEEFEFTLKGTANENYTFKHSSADFFTQFITNESVVHPDYLRHFWTFQAYNTNGDPILDGGEPILCYIENRTGLIVFKNTLPITLSTSQALMINKGWEVTEHLWTPGLNNPVDCQVDILHDFETADQDYSDGNDCTMFPSGHFNPIANTAFPWKATKYHAAYYIVTDEAIYNAQGCDYGNPWMFPNGGYNDNPVNASSTGGENFVMLWANQALGAADYNGLTTTISGLTPGEYYEISFEHSPISTSASGGTRQTDQLQYMPLVNFGGAAISDTPVNYQVYSTTYTNQWYTTTVIMQATASSETLSLEFPILPDPTNAINDGYVGVDNIRITCSNTVPENRAVLANPETMTTKSLSNQIAIYPNPASEHIQVDLLDPSNQIETIELFNLQGRLVWKNEKNGNQTINISSLQRGMYFIKIQTSDKTSITKKIIKQ